jgi:hypothetical protein
LTIAVKGGSDKMQLHLTPLRGYKLKALSFVKLELDKKVDDSYFVFWTYGYKATEERQFWVLIERVSAVLGGLGVNRV